MDLDLRMRLLGPRIPEPYPLIEMAAHNGRADGFRCDQVVATGHGELGLYAYIHNIIIFIQQPIT